jgi:hypothetical protein
LSFDIHKMIILDMKELLPGPRQRGRDA